MNHLSWLLYLTDVLPSLGMMSAIFAVLGAIGYLGGTLVYAGWREEVNRRDSEELSVFHGSYWPIFVILGLFMVSVFTPSRNTILLIAGSEATEAYAVSPEGAELISQVQAAISSELRAKIK